MENLEQKIESVLFFKGEPMSKFFLAEFLKVEIFDLENALKNLSEILKDRGIVLQENGNEISLGTNKEYSILIEDLQKEDLQKDLSKANMETLSIILYKNGATRSEIDYIRGVNSSFILRALSIRGLVEKNVDKEDSRRFIYKPTFELLGFMGVEKIQDLPNYDFVNKKLIDSAKELKENTNTDENIGV